MMFNTNVFGKDFFDPAGIYGNMEKDDDSHKFDKMPERPNDALSGYDKYFTGDLGKKKDEEVKLTKEQVKSLDQDAAGNWTYTQKGADKFGFDKVIDLPEGISFDKDEKGNVIAKRNNNEMTGYGLINESKNRWSNLG